MKKHILISIFMLGGLIACKKSWLEIVPQGSLVATTTQDYNKLMNDPDFYIYYNTGGWGEAQLMGDEVAAETPYFVNKSPIRDALFQWKDSVYPLPGETPFALNVNLRLMYELNKIVDEVMSSEGGSEAQKKGIRAEAMATRAFTIFNLANFYCKPYSASTAGSDLGFPYSDVPDVNKKDFKRGTLQGTYDFITKNLQDALTDIPAKQPIVTRMSRPAVEGLLGKVYVFMGRYSEALPLLKDALAHVAENGQTSLYDYNQTLASGGAFMPIDPVAGPNGPNLNLLDLRESIVSKIYGSGFYSGNQTGSDGLVLTPQAQALFGPNDMRLLFYTNKNPDGTLNSAGRLRKYGMPFQTFQFSRFGLEISELYLLLAECKARTGDLGGAVTDAQMLRRHRMPVADAAVPAAIAGNQAALVKFIIEERIREFAMDGYRWFDMRRLSTDPLFAGTVYVHTMYNADGSTSVFTLPQPNRWVLKFPRFFTDANPDMPDNP
ncbi:RagB/SusD family nutrient uptake outer membrane protein [Chitinophaga sp. YIM B06452]|uniref:RagB/SusD family nutrient uptake outer membrane protein n=1 Tax=Chitinophaga sp. YIM B06452 TaxID=3082158 RepID=UPI0031FF1705